MSLIYFAHEDYGIIEVEAEIASTGRQARVESLSILGWSRIKKRARSIGDGYRARAWFETRQEAEVVLKHELKTRLDYYRIERDVFVREVTEARVAAMKKGIEFRFVTYDRAAKLSTLKPSRGLMMGERS